MSNSYAFKIYVVSLSDRNNGIVHGAWIDFCTCDDLTEVSDIISKMLENSPNAKQTAQMAEEWVIHDYDLPGDLKISEHENIDDLWELYENMCALEDDEIEPFFIFLADRWTRRPLASDINDFHEAYVGKYDSESDFAYSLAEDLNYFEAIPAHLQGYIDYDAFGRDLFIGDYWMGGGYVFHRY